MSDLVLRKTMRVSGDSVNMAMELRTSQLFLLFQEAAGDHAIRLGLGQPYLMEHNRTWVVALMDVRIDRLPRYDDTIAVETWPGRFKHIICPRYYQLRILPKTEDERLLHPDGEVSVRASSVWSILDVEKRVAVNPVAEGLVSDPDDWLFSEEEADPDVRETMAMKRPRALKPGNMDHRSDFTVPFGFVDMNGHMNNARYLDLAENLLFAEPLKEQGASFRVPALSRVEMEYRAEILGGETIPVLWGEETRPENDSGESDSADNGRAFYFQGGGENPAFRMRLTYRE